MEVVLFYHMGRFFESCAQCLKQSVPVNVDLTFFVKIPLGSDQDRGILQPPIFFGRLSDSAEPEIRKALGMINIETHELPAWRIGFHYAFEEIGFQAALFRLATPPAWMAANFLRATFNGK
jgi:hypothetical protein